MKVSIIFLAGILVGTLAHADVSQPDFSAPFDPAKWMEVLTRVVRNGKLRTITDSSGKVTGSLKSVAKSDQNNLALPHTVHYLNIVEDYSDRPDYGAEYISGVRENWKKDATGNWDVDQWLFITSPNGELVRTIHVHIVENAARDLVDYEKLPSTDGNEQQWEQERAIWLSQL